MFMRKIKAMVISVITMLSVSFLLLLLASFIVSKVGVLPEKSLPLITTLVACIAVLAGSFFSSLYAKEKGLLVGLVGSAVYVLVICFFSLVVCKNDVTIAGVGKIIAVLISGAIGGILGVNKKSKVKF